MQRKSFADMQCPIARSLEHVGEWWSMLILRDALHGTRRFDDFRRNLGIAPNMLTRRLGGLVAGGLIERRRYQERPPRWEYVPTERGQEFRPVLLALLAWGNRHYAPEGASVVLVDAESGRIAEPVLVDRVTGLPIVEERFRLAPGPAANARIKARFAAHSNGDSASKTPRRKGRRASGEEQSSTGAAVP